MTITYPPKCPIFKHIWNRTHNYKKLWLQTTTGNSREGKTWCNITMGEHLDKRFNINKIVFTAKEFMDAVSDMRVAGECVVFSELGIAHSSRQWQSLSNLLTNEVLQTIGFIHPIILFDVPDFSYVDSQARKIMNALTSVTRRGNGPSKMWFYMVHVDRKKGEMYYPHPRILMGDEQVSVRSIVFKRKPSPKLLKEFVAKEEDYKERIKNKNRNIIKTMSEDNTDKAKSLTDMIETVIENADEYRNAKGRIDSYVIQTKLGLSFQRSYQVKKMAELKLHNMGKE